MLLKAFAAGCVALTGVEAIANGVPSFRSPSARRAQQTEIALGIILIVMLLGIAFVVRVQHVAPQSGLTLLAQIAANAFGHGPLFRTLMVVVTLVLGLAANTSFGGLPVLLSLLAKDGRAPERVIVVLPRIRTRHRWQQILHNQRTIPLALALLNHYGISVCAVPYYVSKRPPQVTRNPE